MQTHLAPSPLPPVTAEVREAVRSLMASASHYAAARWRIASLEGREALRAGAGMLVAGIAILVSVAIAYAGLIGAFTWWLAGVWEIGAGAAVAALVLVHLALAAACAGWLAHTLRSRRLFHATRKEFKEDKRWLEAHHPSRS